MSGATWQSRNKQIKLRDCHAIARNDKSSIGCIPKLFTHNLKPNK
jgi:hypothetical protein